MRRKPLTRFAIMILIVLCQCGSKDVGELELVKAFSDAYLSCESSSPLGSISTNQIIQKMDQTAPKLAERLKEQIRIGYVKVFLESELEDGKNGMLAAFQLYDGKIAYLYRSGDVQIRKK